MIDLLRDPFTWWVIAGAMLGAFSLIIINTASKNSADKSQKELLYKLENSTNSTINKITGATDTLVNKSKEASKEITATINLANSKLNKQLELVKTATENLKNQMENQEVLVQLNYSFDFTRKNSDDSSEVIPIMDKMINQLSQNNYYQLKIISNGKKSLFMTDINSFYVFDEEIHDADFIKDAFAPIILRNEYRLLSRQFTIKILMKATNLNFLLNDIKAGDSIEFVLLKNLDKARKNETPLRFPFHTFSGSFTPFHYPKSQNEVITGDIDLSIKLRNGKVLNSKTITCEIAGTYANNGFRYYAEVQ